MQIRRSLLFLVVASVVLIALIIWFGKKPTGEPLSTTAETNVAPGPIHRVAREPVQRRSPSPRTNALPTGHATTVVNAPAATSVQTKNEQIREGLAALNDEQVVLYGRVIDQSDSPVGGATVVGSIQVNNGTRVGADAISLSTDANGLFTISGYTGKALGIKITKPGYVMATTNTRFVYSLLWPEAERHVPDPNNPVVFKMWKLQGAEPIVGIDQRYKLQVTDAPIIFDLLTGKIVPSGGDIQITVRRPQGGISERSQQDWGVLVTAVDGGIIETTVAESRVTYSAPETGYKPSYERLLSTTNHTWSGGIHAMLFVESRGGKVYSKVFLSFNINETPDEPASVAFRGVANPSGSRNWEEARGR